MAVYRINEQTLTEMADAIRQATGQTGPISFTEIKTTAEEHITEGVVLPELTNEGIAGDLMLNKELIDAEGNKVTGTFTLENELTTQDDLITQIQAALAGKAAGAALPTLDNPASTSDILRGKEAIDADGNKITGTIDTKTSSNLTASGATVTVPAGYYATQATKSVATGSAKTPATTITKAPTISVNSSGLITASVSGTQNVTPTVSAGYVSSGTAGTITVNGSTTKQLTTQAATTYTPSTSDQTIASGTYLTGVQTIKGDANLIPANIVSGKTIFGVVGTAEAGSGGSGGGGDEDLEAVLTEQEEIIAELTEELKKKTSGEPNLGTCTVIINVPSKTNYYICRETVSDGAITYNITKSYTDSAITQSVRCDSVMYIVAGTIEGAEVTDGEVLRVISGQGLTYKTPSLNNSIAQITLNG